MNILAKFKETAFSVLPVMGIVLVLGLTVAPIGTDLIVRFTAGGIFLIIGLTVFLIGVDSGIQPVGENTGSALIKKRSLLLLLIVSFFIGVLVTAAEPDIQVFGDQIKVVIQSVDKMQVVVMIALGVGLFIVTGLLQSVLRLPIKIILLICYALIFGFAYFTPSVFRGIAFDSGGATTGPMTVPFILALGVGVSSVRANSKNDEKNSGGSFGLTGITSVGPVLAVLIYGIILQSRGVLSVEAEQVSQNGEAVSGMMKFIEIMPEVLSESAISIVPLIGMLLVFQFTLFKLSLRQFIRIFIGLIWSFIGLFIFLVGVKGGFMDAGYQLGHAFGLKACQSGGVWNFLLIFIGLILGAVVVCAEPAVWVLTEQVESLSGGTIKRKLMLVFLSIGAAVAIALAMLRTMLNINLMYILVPGYSLALLLMIFCPTTFTAIAFDSGGVASGPITSSFVLSFALGAGSSNSGGEDGFGVIALVAMTPLIAIQILGIIYHLKTKSQKAEVK